MKFSETYPQLSASGLTENERAVLIRVIKVAFPHESFPDGPYERVADVILEEAESSIWNRVLLSQGLLDLSQIEGGKFQDLDETTVLTTLRQIETTDFFGLVRRVTVLKLYDAPDVWEMLGYEGPSFDKGGYINRGYNDLDWLPDPRIETYEGPETLVEVVAGARLTRVNRSASRSRDTSNQPGSHEAEMTEVTR